MKGEGYVIARLRPVPHGPHVIGSDGGDALQAAFALASGSGRQQPGQEAPATEPGATSARTATNPRIVIRAVRRTTGFLLVV
jgi:hypothetical protein